MIKRNWLWMILAGCAFALLFLIYRIDMEQAVKVAAFIGTVFLLMTLIPNNVVTWVPKQYTQLIGFLRKMIVFRRDFGIVSGLVFALHASFALASYAGWEFSFILTKPIIFGEIALVIFALLLLTSSAISIRLLKEKWKLLHSMVWVAVPFVLLHSMVAELFYRNEYSTIGILGFGGLILCVFVEAILFYRNPQRQVAHKWRHLRFVILGCVLALALFLLYPTK